MIEKAISSHAIGRAPALRPPLGQIPKKGAAATFIGTAGWNVPAEYQSGFTTVGTHLERYATRLNAVEINSSFYRPHRRETYARWARSVPSAFRFAVKIPKTITHEQRLLDSEAQLERFIHEVSGLATQLGVLLVQLPPSLTFDAAAVDGFFCALRSRLDASVALACEPRHRSWFSGEADKLLQAHEVARVAADPPRAPQDGEPGGWTGLNYYRLHGSPRIYYSNYDVETLERLQRKIAASSSGTRATWCIFDNTAAFAALGNALALAALDAKSPPPACQ